MGKKQKVSEQEMMDALNRSGYLLESEITNTLARKGFFVESNQVIEDPSTGKSREIDLIAEYFDYYKERAVHKTVAEITFVFEIKNNLFPIVLLTPFEFSPSIEEWTGLKEVLTIPEKLGYDIMEGFHKELIEDRKDSIYTQYCSFEMKRGSEELMALHPENIHSGLAKITQCCEEKAQMLDKHFNKKKDDYFRHLLFLPVLLIKSDLYELNNGDIKKTESAVMVFNYHFNREAKMAYILVVTKKGFPAFVDSMVKLQRTITGRMIEIRKGKKFPGRGR